MTVKSEAEMLALAIKFVTEDSAARVVFFFPSWERIKLALESLDYFSGVEGSYKHTTTEYIAPSGGMLKFVHFKDADLHHIGGYIITHAFVIDVSYRCYEAARSRVRTSKPTKEYIGVYSTYGAEVRIDY